MEMQFRQSGPVGFGPSMAGYESYERSPSSLGQWQRGPNGGIQPGPPARNWVQQEPGGTGRYRHVMEYDDPLMPGTFPGHWLGPDGEPSVGDQSNLPGANPAFLNNGPLFLQSLLAGKNNNTGVTLGDTLASNPLDNPLDAGFDQVSVPYADPWLVADANVPINVNQGSDQHGGGATIANPTTLENSGGSPEYRRRFNKAFPVMNGGDPTRGGY